MVKHFQRLTQLNPKTGEVVVIHTHRQVPHTLESLAMYGKQGADNETSVNGRTKAGWINVIEYLATNDVEDSVDKETV